MAQLGRPTLLTDEIKKEALNYIESCKDKVKHTEKNGKSISFVEVKFPTGAGLARHLDVNRDTLYEWAKKDPDFSDILDRMNAEQENRLLNQGLAGNYNATIAKLVLGKHGYHEKTETDVTSKGEKINPASDELAKSFTEYLKIHTKK